MGGIPGLHEAGAPHSRPAHTLPRRQKISAGSGRPRRGRKRASSTTSGSRIQTEASREWEGGCRAGGGRAVPPAGCLSLTGEASALRTLVPRSRDRQATASCVCVRQPALQLCVPWTATLVASSSIKEKTEPRTRVWLGTCSEKRPQTACCPQSGSSVTVPSGRASLKCFETFFKAPCPVSGSQRGPKGTCKCSVCQAKGRVPPCAARLFMKTRARPEV